MKGLIFTYVLTYGGAAAAVLNPFAGLLIYVCFAIIKPEALWFWSVPAGNYSRIVAIALLGGWVVHGCGRWQFGAAKGVVLALLGFWVWSALSATAAPNPLFAWGFVERLAKTVLPFLVGVTMVDSVQKLKQLAWVIALSQGYVAYELNLSYYEGFNRVQEIGFAGMDNNSVAIAMVTGVGLAFFLALASTHWWQKVIAFACAILMAHVVMFAFSRGGMLALCVTAMVSFLLVPKQPRHYVLFGAALLLGLRLAGPEVVDRFMTAFVDPEERDASAQSRIVMWGHCMEVMARHPFTGCGPDHFQLVSREFGFHGLEAHTLWLQTGAELGVPGLAFLIGFYAICCRRLWTLRHPLVPADPWLKDAARMVIASIAGFAVAAQFVTLEGLELPYYVTMLGAGVLKLASVPNLAFAPIAAERPPVVWSAPAMSNSGI